MKLIRYIEIIEEQLNVTGVRALASFKEYGADSLDMVELVMALEEETGVDLPDNLVDEDNIGLLFTGVIKAINRGLDAELRSISTPSP